MASIEIRKVTTSTRSKELYPKLYQIEASPFCDKVRRALIYKRINHEIVELGLTENIKKLGNSMGKVPFLEVAKGEIIGDSTEIIKWLEKHYLQPPLYPNDPKQRALCHILEDWADESLYFYEMRIRFVTGNNNAKWAPELTKHSNALVQWSMPKLLPMILRGILDKQGLGRKPQPLFLQEVRNHVHAIAELLNTSDWLVCDHLSAADLAVFAQFFCINATPEGSAIFQDYPSVLQWLKRVEAATTVAVAEADTTAFPAASTAQTPPAAKE